MPAKVDRSALIGKRFGRWTVLSEESVMRRRGRRGMSPEWYLRCRCDCGSEKAVPPNHIVSGASQSCGCDRPNFVRTMKQTHGHAPVGKPTPEYAAWRGMMVRCYNKNASGYLKCGAKGIKVCPAWRDSFEQFLADVGPRPSDNHLLRRVEPLLDFEPNNVIWSESGRAMNFKGNRPHGVIQRLLAEAE